MKIDNPILLVRALKGSAISILFAISVAHQNVGAEWLARITGYTDKPIQDGLLLLQEYELVVRVDRNHWGLTGAAKRLPLMVDESALPLVTEIETTRNNSESALPASSATTTIEGKQGHGRKKAEEAKSTRNYSESLSLLHEGGVGEPMASRLAGLAWVTPVYIKAHLAYGLENHDRIGIVIHRMQYSDPAPLSEEEKRARSFSNMLNY